MATLKVKENGQWVEIPSVANVKKQIYKGSDYPLDNEVLIWIDTSLSPITGTQLITADNLGFYTSENEAFIVNEIIENALLTSDDKEFIEANNKNFVLKEEL